MIRTILLVALVLRIIAAFYWQGNLDRDNQLFRFGDSETYWILAEKIAAGKPYDYAGPNSRVFRTPLYPLFLAPATLFEHRVGVLVARIAGCIVGTITVGLVMFAASQIIGRRAAAWAGIFAAIYPGAVGMSVFILSEAIFCPLCLLCLIAWQWADDNHHNSPGDSLKEERVHADWPVGLGSVVSGVACGLACLARPSWLLWPVLLAMGTLFECWLYRRKDRSDWNRFIQIVARLGVFGLAMSLTMSPWWYRNYLVTGHFVPTTLQVGPSLYDGLHAGASGASDEGMSFSLPFETELHVEDAKRENAGVDGNSVGTKRREPFEWRLNQRMLNAAILWAAQNPSDTVRLALVKFHKMWNPWPTAKELGSVWIRISESVVYVIILALAGIAIGSIRQHRRQLMLFVAPTIYFAALHVVFVGSVRYRQPAILVLCVVAGIGAAWMLDRINEWITPNRIRKP
jgi:4-amino-4-deoxy-L-arabinose transferase-like glycosyltransferase